jgi:hypothetical protein
MRKGSERFGSVPKHAESFGTVRNGSEKTEQHTLTVREAARIFESSGVARTECSIINWCQPNRQGVARLDAFFDTNERRYFITPQSVHLAIKEEQAKQVATGNPLAQENELPKRSETAQPFPENNDDSEHVQKLRQEVVDLKITNRVKDQAIEMLQKEREHFGVERDGYVRELMSSSHRIGTLESQLHQLGGPISEGRLHLGGGS